MSRKLLIVVVALTLMLSFGFAQEYQWVFKNVLVDYNLPQSNGYGIHGVVVDPDGNIWVGLHGIMTDTLFTGTDTIPLNPIYVYSPDGNQVSFSPIKFITVNGDVDTLNSDLKCKGLHLDNNGNILYSAGAYALYRINYKTGEGMNKFLAPISSSITEAACDKNGYIYFGYVLGGDKPVHILDPDFNYLGDAIDTLGYINRTMEVSADGKDLYTGSTWLGFGIVKYHSDLPGVLKFEPVDTIGNWDSVYVPETDTTYYDVKLWASSLDWGPDSLLWAGNLRDDWSSGGAGTGSKWYAFDVNTGDIVYTVGNPYPTPANEGGVYSPRGAAWSPDGKTMYLADYDYNCVTVWEKQPTAIKEGGQIVARVFNLYANYPNPFNPTTTIPFELKKRAHVELKVFDVQGREIATLVNQTMDMGVHKFEYNASNLSSGIYFYQLRVDGMTLTRQMILVK
ncbi:T9SS type A sorting domain-containing protein [Calditrichota bacterium LG25]